MNKLIYIEWADAVSNTTWFDDEMAVEWADNTEWVVKQVGWVIKETKEYICIASRRKEEDTNTVAQWGQLEKIPKTWIRKRKNL